MISCNFSSPPDSFLIIFSFCFAFTACKSNVKTTVECDPQIQLDGEASLRITKKNRGFVQVNNNGNGGFEFRLLPDKEDHAIIRLMSDSTHNFCMSTNTNIKMGLNQESTYKYTIHNSLINGDTSLFYIDCFKPIYRVISSEDSVSCKLMVTSHSLGEFKDTIDITIIR